MAAQGRVRKHLLPKQAFAYTFEALDDLQAIYCPADNSGLHKCSMLVGMLHTWKGVEALTVLGLPKEERLARLSKGTTKSLWILSSVLNSCISLGSSCRCASSSST